MFAGYGSMRATAKQKGLNYLAVDWKDFISGTKLHKATVMGKEDYEPGRQQRVDI